MDPDPEVSIKVEDNRPVGPQVETLRVDYFESGKFRLSRVRETSTVTGREPPLSFPLPF